MENRNRKTEQERVTRYLKRKRTEAMYINAPIRENLANENDQTVKSPIENSYRRDN